MWGKRERDQVVRNAQRYLNGWAGSWLSEQLQLYCKQMATFKRNSIQRKLKENLPISNRIISTNNGKEKH